MNPLTHCLPVALAPGVTILRGKKREKAVSVNIFWRVAVNAKAGGEYINSEPFSNSPFQTPILRMIAFA